MDPFRDPPDLQRIAGAALELAPNDFFPRHLSAHGDEYVSPEEMATDQPKFMLFGDAGSGKSVLFKQMVNSAAREFLNGVSAHCPILIQGNELVRMIGDANHRSLVNGNVLLSFSELILLTSSGEATLYLDGFDELSSDSVSSPALWDLISKAKFVAISTRPPVHQAFSEWPVYQLQPLNSHDVRQLTEILSKDQRIAEEFSKSIAQHDGLSDLMRSPLLLKMMLEVFAVRGSLPTNPAVLYAMLIDTHIDRWDAKRSSVNTLDRARRLHFLSQVACAMYERREYALYHSDIVQFLRSENDANLRAEDIWSDIATVGLMHRLYDGRYQFSHKSLMMYLVAFHFQMNPVGLAALLRQNDSSWRELVSFFGALSGHVDGLVHAFLEFDWVTQAAYSLSVGQVREEKLEHLVADRVEAQLGTKFTRSAAEYWLSKDEAEIPNEIRTRKKEEHELFQRAIDPDLAAHERGKRFEEFVAAFFDGPFKLIDNNVLTLHGEFDLVFELVAKGPFWRDLGGLVLLECKNEAKRADTEQVNHFMQKVNNVQNVRLAFFVARKGVGRAALDAMRVQAANPAKTLVVPINGEQITADLETNFEREDFFVRLISDAKLMRR